MGKVWYFLETSAWLLENLSPRIDFMPFQHFGRGRGGWVLGVQVDLTRSLTSSHRCMLQIML